MSVNITPEIQAAYIKYLDEPVDWDMNGLPILRKHTYPYNQPHCTGLVSFAGGYQAASQKEQK